MLFITFTRVRILFGLFDTTHPLILIVAKQIECSSVLLLLHRHDQLPEGALTSSVEPRIETLNRIKSAFKAVASFTSAKLALLTAVHYQKEGSKSYYSILVDLLESLSVHWSVGLMQVSILIDGSEDFQMLASVTESLGCFRALVCALKVQAFPYLSCDVEERCDNFIHISNTSESGLSLNPLEYAICQFIHTSRIQQCRKQEDSLRLSHFLSQFIHVLIDFLPHTVCGVDGDGSTPMAILASCGPCVTSNIQGPWVSVVMASMTAAAREVHFLADTNGDMPVHVAAACGNEAVLMWIVGNIPLLAGQTNDLGCCPLHLALSSTTAHSDEVVLKLLEVYPNAASVADYSGRLPLHYALERSSLRVVEAVYLCFPDAVRGVTEDSRSSCLHFAAQRDSISEVESPIPSLLRIDTAEAREWTPVVCESSICDISCVDNERPAFRSELQLIEALVSAAPEMQFLRDDGGRTPLHIACGNCFASSQVVNVLLHGCRRQECKNDYVQSAHASRVYSTEILSHEVIESSLTRFPDAEENLPLHLAAGRLDGLSCCHTPELLMQCILTVRLVLTADPAAGNAENDHEMLPLDILRVSVDAFVGRGDDEASISRPISHDVGLPVVQVAFPAAFEGGNAVKEGTKETAKMVCVVDRAHDVPCDQEDKREVEGEQQRSPSDAENAAETLTSPRQEEMTQFFETFKTVERLLLRANTGHDPPRLHQLNWEERRGALLAWARLQCCDPCSVAAPFDDSSVHGHTSSDSSVANSDSAVSNPVDIRIATHGASYYDSNMKSCPEMSSSARTADCRDCTSGDTEDNIASARPPRRKRKAAPSVNDIEDQAQEHKKVGHASSGLDHSPFMKVAEAAAAPARNVSTGNFIFGAISDHNIIRLVLEFL